MIFSGILSSRSKNTWILYFLIVVSTNFIKLSVSLYRLKLTGFESPFIKFLKSSMVGERYNESVKKNSGIT